MMFAGRVCEGDEKVEFISPYGESPLSKHLLDYHHDDKLISR